MVSVNSGKGAIALSVITVFRLVSDEIKQKKWWNQEAGASGHRLPSSSTCYTPAMKISLKSPTLDLDVDDKSIKLDEVLEFVRKFKQLELEIESAKSKLQPDVAKELSTTGATKKKPTGKVSRID